jgi:hypothetical protein
MIKILLQQAKRRRRKKRRNRGENNAFRLSCRRSTTLQSTVYTFLTLVVSTEVLILLVQNVFTSICVSFSIIVGPMAMQTGYGFSKQEYVHMRFVIVGCRGYNIWGLF